MYSLLIVDDEPYICKGIHAKIQRINNPKISEVTECYDSQEALEIIRQNQPDIVIVDMKMPNLTGLELIQSLNLQRINSKFLVLSGHDDYHYVRESFQHGVIDYLLKPISMEDLKTQLENIINLLDSGKQQDHQLDKNLGSIINQLIGKTSGIAKIEALDYIKERLSYPYCQLGALTLDKNNNSLKLNEFIDFIFKDMPKEITFLCYYDIRHLIIFIFNYKDENSQLTLVKYIVTRLQELKKNQFSGIKIALTSCAIDLRNLSILFEQLNNILAARIIYEPYSLMLFESDLSDNTTTVDTTLLRKVNQWFLSKSYSAIQNFIDSYFVTKSFNLNNLKELQKLYVLLLQKMNTFLSSSISNETELFTRTFESFEAMIELRIYLKDCLFKLQHHLDMLDQQSISLIDSAITYINDHLHEELNMLDICKHLSINYTYFSKLFKQTLNISYKKYLIQIRMEKAKQLMQNPSNRIYEIALQVGYENAQNFSRAFKAHFGYSPKDYRSK